MSNQESNQDKVERSDAEWREQLSEEEFQVARCSATEPAFSGRYWDEKAAGTYRCVCCDSELFRSEGKYDSGTGWPSFFQPIEESAVAEKRDTGHGMVRIESVCAKCDSVARTRVWFLSVSVRICLYLFIFVCFFTYLQKRSSACTRCDSVARNRVLVSVRICMYLFDVV